LFVVAAVLLVQTGQASSPQPFPIPGKYYAILRPDDENMQLSLGDKTGGKVACQTTWGEGENLWKFEKVGENFRLFNKKFEKDKLTAFKKQRTFGTFDGVDYDDQLWKVTPLGGRKVNIENAYRKTKLQLSSGPGECGMSKKNEPSNKSNVWLLDDQTYNPSIVIPEGAKITVQVEPNKTESVPKCENPQKLSTKKVSCTASSKWGSKYGCKAAFDGISTCSNRNNGWYSKSGKTVVGQWIEATFDKKIIITSVKIMNTYKPAKGIEISFDGNYPLNGDLGNGCTTWKEISLAHPVETKTLKLTVNSVDAKKNLKYAGVKEIQVFGC